MNTRRSNLTWLLFCLSTLLIVLGSISCSTEDVAAPPVEQSHSDPTFMAYRDPLNLPSPGVIARAVTELGSGQVLNGADFSDMLPSNLVVREDTSAKYQPTWTEGLEGAAYAMYAQDFSDAMGAVDIGFTWTTPPAMGEPAPVFWLGLSNWDRDVWEWIAPDDADSYLIEMIDPYVRDSDGMFIIVVLLVGNDEAVLATQEYAPLTAPFVDSVSPASGSASSWVQFSADVISESPVSYSWSFGAGASPATSTDAMPNVQLGSTGSYACSVEVSNAAGTVQYPFNLSITPEGTWIHSYGNEDTEEGRACVSDASDNLYVASSSLEEGVGLIKYSLTGTMLWARRYQVSTGSSYDSVNDIALDISGNLYIVGGIGGTDFGKPTAALIVKYNSDGVLQWAKTWNSPSPDEAYGVVTYGTSDVYVCGDSWVGGKTQVFVLKLNSSGSLLWQKEWGGSDEDRAHTVAVTNTGAVLVGGATKSYATISTVVDGMLLEYTSAGALTGETSLVVGALLDVDFDSSNNIYIACGNAWIVKLDSSSNLLWVKEYADVWGEAFDRIRVAPNNTLFAFSDTRYYGSDHNQDLILTKCDLSGGLLWSGAFNGGDVYKEFGNGLALASDGVFVTGSSDDAFGEWRDLTGDTNVTDIITTPTAISGTHGDNNGTVEDASGSESMWEAVADTGGGDNDVFVMKWKP